ncbi:SEC-C metal-binding domain-containing protein [Virgibacillus siamensis]|uniref:SEC-C metal-binding domain-containing protein n=1 Tax=Virgibacillus siamensis TaxID=480071 RepID=A0ABP3RBV2_9BACI
MSNQTKSNKKLQDGLPNMLEALTKMKADLDAREEKHTWRDIQVPISLYDALSRLTKDELTDIRKKLDIQKASSLKKGELIQLLQQRIPAMFEKICLQLDSVRYSLIEKIAHHNGSMNAKHLPHNIHKNLGNYGVVFTGSYKNEKVAVIPNELLEAFQSFNHTNVLTTVNRNTEWIRLTHGLLYYYGALSTSKLIEMVKKYLAYDMDTFEFLTVIHDAENCYKKMKADWNGFAHAKVFDSKIVLDEHRNNQDIPYYPFSKTQLITAGAPGYMEQNKSFKQFVTFLTQLYDISVEEVEMDVNECAHGFKIGQTPQDVLEILQKQFKMDNDDIVTFFMDFLLDLYNNTRQWLLKGYTPEELHEMEKRNLKPSPKQTDNVIDFQSGNKIGRNDPCPCGSGKKYKKCCGR